MEAPGDDPRPDVGLLPWIGSSRLLVDRRNKEMDDMHYTNKTVLIIGGTSGIGHATAIAFASEGAQVIVTGRSKQKASEIAKAIGPTVKSHSLDLSDTDQVATFAETVRTLNALVITAGVTHFTPTEFEQPETFKKVINVNLTGTFFALQALAPKVTDAGAIVLTTTVLAKDYFFGATALSASRAGLAVALRTFAIELAPRGVRVNAVSVGPIETAAWDKAGATEEDRAGVRAKVPLGRLGRAAEVADAVLFLASERASYVTGHELAVDGGWGAA
jgi:NAD(P)-dependent dehydrogenase (short-subunit alcohol dehydrogenase family)